MGKEVNSIPRISQVDFDFNKFTEHKGKSVVIFSADWCPYCVSFLIIGQSILKFPMFS